MKTDQTFPLLFAPFRIWADYALKVGELTLASSQVIAQRSRLLLSGAAPTAADQRELALMSQEKYGAAAESAQAMAFGYMSIAPQMAMLAFRQMAGGFVPFTTMLTLNPFQLWSRQANAASGSFARSAAAANQVSRSVEKIASRGLKPIHKRAVANARRLKRKAA
jgi:hypothetical protein